MAFLRADNDSRGPEPEALIDDYLLEMFPGRTLEELDGMDWLRLQRALDARMVRRVEEQRQAYLRGDLKSEQIPVDRWALIKEHDELLEYYGAEQTDDPD